MPLPLPYAPVQHCAAYAACTVRRHFLFHAKYAAGQYYNVVYLPLYPLSTRLIYPALYVYSIYMHVTVSRQGTSTATTTIDLCVLSTNSVPKLVPRLLQPRLLLSWHSSCTFVVFLTRASTSIVQLVAQWLGYSGGEGRTKGGRGVWHGSVEKFFSFSRTHKKRYFIEFFVAQSESAPKIVVGTKFSISFSILVHLPATVATPPPRAACCSFTLLLASFFKNFASFCRFCVDFRQPGSALSSLFPSLSSSLLSPLLNLSFLFVALAFFNPIEA